MGRGQWGGVKAERVQPRSLTVCLQRTKLYVKFISADKELQDRVKAEIDCSANLRSATGSC
ncbi:unnamed protein product [Ascophyllum nodosum]